jgi:hypothetical protein
LKEKYVLNLLEDGIFGGNSNLIGYWDGKKYRGEDVCFPGVIDNKHDKGVKVYNSKKLAENAVKKFKDKFTYVTDAEIEILD